jgi:hypothetical protein
MKEVFPENHHTHCAVHIERNVLTRFGLLASKCIQQIAKTFSVQKERLWLLQLNKISPKTYEYILSIDPNTWRTSSWSKEASLPPRYGITSSNISESTNSMFDKARDCPWLYCIDTILNIVTTRMFNLQSENLNKNGVMPPTQHLMQQRYQMCAGFEVIQLHETTDKFKVNRTNGPLGEVATAHRVDI